MVSDLQIPLEIKPIHPWRATFVARITKALPFYRSMQGRYVHRVRSGTLHQLTNREPHAAYSLWCGGTGFVSRNQNGNLKGELLPDIPAGAVLCATCEGRAVGAGLLGAPIIAGRVVKYAPRI